MKVMARFPPVDIVKMHLLAAGFTLDANSVTVPTERALIAEEKYFEHGVSNMNNVQMSSFLRVI